MKYVYPAIFTKEETDYSIHFPDIESCYTQGEDLKDGMEMAEDILALTLYRYERDGKEIPAPSGLKDIMVNDDSFVSLIKCDTMEYRKLNNSKAIKKTLTIPEWLNEEASARGVNFSQVLKEALIHSLESDH